MKIKVNQDACIGCGACAAAVPAAFAAAAGVSHDLADAHLGAVRVCAGACNGEPDDRAA